jgi:hypothetical protein
MGKFDLSNFEKVQELSDTGDEGDLPSYYFKLSDNGKKLFHKILEKSKDVETAIKNDSSLPVNKRRIIASQVASEVGVSRSALQKRRHPELVALLNEENKRLERLWKVYGQNSTLKQKSRKELLREISRLKKQIAYEKDKNYSQAITVALKSELSTRQKSLATKVAQLEAENDELTKANEKLKAKLLVIVNQKS